MIKIIEKRVAEMLVICVMIIVLMTGCGSTYNSCAAYAQAEYNIGCENCDEID
tara:strand:+ start:1016 stop:1174 length:159 start_codon:yes stop_codon:yes gene_type:complete